MLDRFAQFLAQVEPLAGELVLARFKLELHGVRPVAFHLEDGELEKSKQGRDYLFRLSPVLPEDASLHTGRRSARQR